MYKYRKQLEKIFFRKISRELKLFKSRMMKMEKEEIFRAAYKIDGVICIYETLIEINNRMDEETLEALTAFPGLLSFLYDRWLRYEDSQMDDIMCCLNKEVTKIQEEYQNRKKRRRKAA